MDYDLIVIGGGAAGLAAARAALRRRARTLLVQDGPPGGDCTFTGCVPSKTLIEAAGQGSSFPQAMARVHAAIGQIAATEDAQALRAEGIEVLDGRATFTSPRTVDVAGERISARRFVVATGARPVMPPVPGLAEVSPLTNESVFDLTAQPASLIVMGGGPIGCELAQAFARLGTTVTIVEALPRLLPREEPEASEVIRAVFTREGIVVRTGEMVAQAAPHGTGVRLTLASGGELDAATVLVAVGRAPVTDGLNLSAAEVRTDERGFIVTDERLATTSGGIYAAGDVTGRLAFTHAADEMGRIATGNALRRRGSDRFRVERVPWVTFTDPEVAHVGMHEAQAAKVGGRVAYLPMTEVDRAITAGHTDGYVKLITGPRRLLRAAGGGQVLGATIVASRAGEMIAEPALAIRTAMFAGRLAQTTHAYPTWSGGVQQAAAQLFFQIGGRRARPARPD